MRPDTTDRLFQPHDLLWFNAPTALSLTGPLPDWLTHTDLSTRPVVVRRDTADTPGPIPVGIRGYLRHQRQAAWLDSAAITRILRPQDLVTVLLSGEYQAANPCPPLTALSGLAPALNTLEVIWGPTGSVACQLATGQPVCRSDSDLDLVMRLATPPRPDQVETIHALLNRAPCRVDLQIDTGHGAFAFQEWRANPPLMLLKTNRGPVSIALHKGESPWAWRDVELPA